MYLLSRSTFIKQIIPPHWRETYRQTILMVLLAPIFRVYKEFMTYKNTVLEDVNMSSQVLVIDQAVKRVSESQLSYVVDYNNYQYQVYLPKNISKEKEIAITQLLEKYKLSGTNYQIKKMNQ